MKYRIAAVSYLNTIPFLQGLRTPELRDAVEIITTHPVGCADLLMNGSVDIALCPVGALPHLEAYYILTDYCIGCEGPVRTVAVFSDVPFQDLRQIVLSAESRTSNLLVQVLESRYWRHGLRFVNPDINDDMADPEHAGKTGYLIIGDRCFDAENRYRYQCDLGQAWIEATRMPFVFACWVSQREIDRSFQSAMNSAFEESILSLHDLDLSAHMHISHVREYLTRHISFHLNTSMRAGMQRFLDEVAELQIPLKNADQGTYREPLGTTDRTDR